MMLNEDISITSSGAKLSGIGKTQPLKDGAFVGLGQFTDDIEPQQINFISVLSKFGSGIVQVSPEESKNANLKLAEGQFPGEIQEDKAVAGKPKGKQEKQEKDGGVVKRLQSGYPQAHVIVMGLLALPDSPQPDLPADFAFHVPGPENEEETVSVFAASDWDSAVQVGGIMVDPGQRVGPSATSEPVSSVAGHVQAVEIAGPQMLPGRWQPAGERVLEADRSDAGRESMPTDQNDDSDIPPQTVKVRSAAVYPAGDAVETGKTAPASDGALNADNNDTPNMFMAANKLERIAGGEEGSYFQPTELESAASAVNFVRENHTETALRVSESPKEFRPEGQSFHTEVLKQIAEKTSTSLKSGQSEIRIDLKPESLGHLRLHVLTDNQQVTVKILAENPRVKEMIENQASLIKNELQNQGIHVNTVKVEMLMSGGSDFAYPQHEGTAFRQDRHEPAYGSGKDDIGDAESKEPDSLDKTGNRGRSLVNYFA